MTQQIQNIRTIIQQGDQTARLTRLRDEMLSGRIPDTGRISKASEDDAEVLVQAVAAQVSR